MLRKHTQKDREYYLYKPTELIKQSLSQNYKVQHKILENFQN